MNDPRRKDKEPEHDPDGKRVYDLGCRFKHGDPTWYHSWLYSLKIPEQQKKEQDAERMKELESSWDVSRGARCCRDQSLGLPNGSWIVLGSLNGGCEESQCFGVTKTLILSEEQPGRILG